MTFIAPRTPWLDQLADLPSNWALVCVNEKKQPYDPCTGLLTPGWNDGDGHTVEDVLALDPAAVGVMLGPKSGGLLAIDFDGPGSEEKFLEVIGKPASELPKTISWSSGRIMRRQIAYSVDPEYWPLLFTRKFKNEGATILEFRWEGCQSVLAGAHPETGSYHWVEGCSPTDIPEPTAAPYWLIEALTALNKERVSVSKRSADDSQRALEMLRHLQPGDFTTYQSWLQIGMALHHTDPMLLTAWIDFSRQMDNFDEKECHAKWKSFGKGKSQVTIASLHNWAKAYGYKEPASSANPPGSSIKAFNSGSFAALKAKINKEGGVCANVGKVPFRVEGFAVSGLVLLAAETGAGKTTLLYRAAEAIQTGTPFLESVPVRQGNVLFVQGDEPSTELQAKRRRMNLNHFHDLCIDEPLNLDFILELIKTKEYDVIIIDSLTTVLVSHDCTTLDQTMIDKLYLLNNTAAENDILVLMTAHLNKPPKNGNGERYRPRVDWYDISGLSTIGAAVTDAWGLTPKLGTDQFSLHALGKRNVQRDTEWLLSRDEEDFYWRLDEVSDGLKPDEHLAAKQRILELLGDGQKRRYTEIAAQLKLNPEHARRCLAELYVSGLITREQSSSGGGRPPYLYWRP